jgi:hypothetical protein
MHKGRYIASPNELSYDYDAGMWFMRLPVASRGRTIIALRMASVYRGCVPTNVLFKTIETIL